MKCFLATAALLASSSLAAAGTVNIASDSANSTSNLGAFTGSLTYVGGTLTVSLANTSGLANGGYITGFLMNIDDTNATGVFVDANDATTTGVNEADFGNTGTGAGGSPFGSFELGAALGSNFLGGGNPSKGVGVGETGIFNFTITDPDTNVVVDSFMSQLSTGNGGNGKQAAFLVRFRGFENDGSDKVPGLIDSPPPAIPVPPAAWMVLGTMGMMVAPRVRKMIAKMA